MDAHDLHDAERAMERWLKSEYADVLSRLGYTHINPHGPRIDGENVALEACGTLLGSLGLLADPLPSDRYRVELLDQLPYLAPAAQPGDLALLPERTLCELASEAERRLLRARLALDPAQRSIAAARLQALRWVLQPRPWCVIHTRVPRPEVLDPRHAATDASRARAEELWSRLEQRYEVAFQPAVAEREIEVAEAEVGFRFPSELVASLLTRNGESCAYAEALRCGMDPPADLEPPLELVFSLQEMLRAWAELEDELVDDPEWATTRHDCPGVKQGFWHRGLLPVAGEDGTGDYICVDLDPDRGGRFGQVVDLWHETGPTAVVAPDYLSWLATLAR